MSLEKSFNSTFDASKELPADQTGFLGFPYCNVNQIEVTSIIPLSM